MTNPGYPSKELIMAAQYVYSTTSRFTEWVNKTWNLKCSPYDFGNSNAEEIAYMICIKILMHKA